MELPVRIIVKQFSIHKIINILYVALLLNSTAALCSDERYLKEMGDAYLNLKTYSDEGTILSYWVTDGPKANSYSKFTTKYKRPNKLNFTWIENNHYMGTERKYSIVEDGGSLILYRPGKTPEKYSSRYSIFSSLAGLSSGASFLVPVFLEYGYNKAKFDRIYSVEHLGEEIINNHLCDVVKVTYKHGTIETLWLDKRSHLLRRYEDIFYPEHAKQGIRAIIEYTEVVAQN